MTSKAVFTPLVFIQLSQIENGTYHKKWNGLPETEWQ